MTEINHTRFNFTDIPEHQPNLVSSIGGLWPPEIASFNRVKAFFTPSVITSNDTFTPYLQAFHESLSQMANGPVSRVQFRAVIDGEILRNLAGDSTVSKFIEAVIPLDRGVLGEEPVLVYFGANRHDRQPNTEDLGRIRSHYEHARQIRQRGFDESGCGEYFL